MENPEEPTLDAREKRMQALSKQIRYAQEQNNEAVEICKQVLRESEAHYKRSKWLAIVAIFFFSLICAKSVYDLYQLYQATGTS